MTRFIGVLSGKGGVGKTTTALNLGLALHLNNRSVILVDANLTNANVGLNLGSTNIPITLHDVLNNKNKLSDAAYMHESGLKVILGSISLSDLKTNSLNLKDKVKYLRNKSEVVIFDSVAGLGDDATSILNVVDDVLIVTNPDTAAVTDALKTIHLCEKHKVNILGVIVNRFIGDSIDMSLESIESMLEKKIIGVVPEDYNIRKSQHLSHPVLHLYPNSISSLAYKKLANYLITGKLDYFERNPGFFKKFLLRLGLNG